MKTVHLNSAQFVNLFGVVELKPGPNEVSPEAWAKVKNLRLGDMTEPYVEWARSRDVLRYEDDQPAPVPQVAEVPTFNEEAQTLEHEGETLDVVAVGLMDPDSPAMADDAAPVADAPVVVPDAGAAVVPVKRRPGRPRKDQS